MTWRPAPAGEGPLLDGEGLPDDQAVSVGGGS